MFCAESSVVVFLSLLRFRLVILLFYVFILYLYPCAAHCAYSVNEWMNEWMNELVRECNTTYYNTTNWWHANRLKHRLLGFNSQPLVLISVGPNWLLVRVVNLPGRCSLRSARTNRLLVPSIKLSTILAARPSHHLEQSAGQCYLRSISVDLPSASENISLSLVPWHYHRLPLNYSHTFSGSWSDTVTWTTLKIYDWLTNRLTD